ncbi:MAG: hypothetical protein MZV63_70410 [Marinilabiliales bacterium]|nr:hypothetical protein [Marinilabiliales bacterium]
MSIIWADEVEAYATLVYVLAVPLLVESIVGSVTSSLLHDPVKRLVATNKLNIDFFIFFVLKLINDQK